MSYSNPFHRIYIYGLLCLPIFPIAHQMLLSMVVPCCFFSCANYQWTMKNLLKIFTKQIQTQINKKAYRHRHHCRFCRCSHKQLLLIFNIRFQIKKRKTDFLQDNWEFLLFFPRKLSNARYLNMPSWIHFFEYNIWIHFFIRSSDLAVYFRIYRLKIKNHKFAIINKKYFISVHKRQQTNLSFGELV